MDDKQFIERRILTGLIVSTEYVRRVRRIWDDRLISHTARKLAGWCLAFYDQYNAAPGKEIESIFMKQARSMRDVDAGDIGSILEGLSDEYERKDKFNVDYLYDQTVQYFNEQGLVDLIDNIRGQLDQGDVEAAQKEAYNYKPAVVFTEKNIDLSDPEVLERVERAFDVIHQPVVSYPRQLGGFWNDEFVRGGFVALMGSEKRGKSFWLLDIAVRAARQGANVAFFQAGDMTEAQQLLRTAIYLTKKSNKEKFTGRMLEPVRDCIRNQLDICNLKSRECNFGPFTGEGEETLRKEITFKDLKAALKDNPDYRPCYNCSKYWNEPLGAVWLREVDIGKALDAKEARQAYEKFFIDNKRRFKLSTHPNKTLTVSAIEAQLDQWERVDEFVVDVVIVDYADILAPEIRADFRHQENDKWMRLRGLSERRHALVITATQADAASYEADLLRRRHFSEDHRKYAHVTAMFGLNQDGKGREKEIGIMRLNKLVVREDEFLESKVIYVLQNLRRGQPCLSSFW